MNIIDIKNCSIYQSKLILDNFSLRVDGFEHTAIIGPNGSGKSTFIRMLMKELYPARHLELKPEIKILGRDDWNIFELRRIVSLVSPKFSEHLLSAAPLNLFDAVASSFNGSYGFFFGDAVTKSQIEITNEVLEVLHLSQMKDQSIEELSSGELRKVLIARSMVLKPKLVLLDEPTAGLDILAQHEFLKYLEKIADKTTILMVTHHLEEIIPLIKKVLLIKDGKIFKFGNKEEVLTQENLSELFEIKLELNQSREGIYSIRKL